MSGENSANAMYLFPISPPSKSPENLLPGIWVNSAAERKKLLEPAQGAGK